MTEFPDKQKLLVLGSGGREHALCWKLALSERVEIIYCAPGNGGTASESKTQNINLSVMDFNGIAEFAATNNIDMVIIGPENPLSEGLVDFLNAKKIKVFGPTQAAAQLEASKAYAKEFMSQYQLPTARFGVFEDLNSAKQFCQDNKWARVIKADGLALGKGVFVCDNLNDCVEALEQLFIHNACGEAGNRVVIEERLNGPETSLLLFCDGTTIVPCQLSQDYKRRLEGNKGPNTGGMGSFSPVKWADEYAKLIQTNIILPLEKALQDTPTFTYKGILFVGLLFHEKKPYLLEFNCRFGDPETQSILPRLESDLLAHFEACIDGNLTKTDLKWSNKHATCIVITAESYPAQGSKDEVITLPKTQEHQTFVFHAGTKQTESGELLTNGGRVLNSIGLAETHEEAINRAYETAARCEFKNSATRKDIGQLYLEAEQAV